MSTAVAGRSLLLPTLALTVTVAYGTLYYGYSVLITDAGAGSDFSTSLLATAYGGAILSSGVAAMPVGRIADRRGVRGITASGALLGGAGLAGFTASTEPWQVLLAWWVLLGPAMAMTFYEPAYVAIQQAFEPKERPRAIALLTLSAGLSGPIFIPLTAALIDTLDWRAAGRWLAAAYAVTGVAALGGIRYRRVDPDDRASPRSSTRGAALVLLRPRFALFTLAAAVAFGALEALVILRVSRFEAVGFGLGTISLWAGISGLLTIPGRFLLPSLANRCRGTVLLAAVLIVIGASTALMVRGTRSSEMVLSFCLFGLVFGAAMPLRAIIMGQWLPIAGFGVIMGAQAAVLAVSRAGGPSAIGWLRDLTDGYEVPMIVLTMLFCLGALLVVTSERLRAAPAGGSQAPPATAEARARAAR